MHLSELGITKRSITAMQKKHIHTVEDLLQWFPRKYRDYREIRDILDCPDGEYAAVSGRLMKVQVKQGAKGAYLRLSFLSNRSNNEDGTDVWFRADLFVSRYARYLEKKYSEEYLKKDVVVTGKICKDPQYGISVTDAAVELPVLFKNEIVRIYPKIGGFKDEDFRSWLEQLLQLQGEVLEDAVRKECGLETFRDALNMMHHPQTPEDIEAASRQFVFYDLLWFAMQLKEMEGRLPEDSDIKLTDRSLMDRFLSKCLPFRLTELTPQEREENRKNGVTGGGQMDVVRSMAETAASGKRLNALVEGDVGCGKTLVAAAMIMLAAGNGYQAVITAPKTVLARQHYEEISAYCGLCGLRCAFLSSSAKTAEEKRARKEDLRQIESGEIQVVVGTHSCFGKDVTYKKLGLIIYDEEQEFGVDQKVALYDKALPGVHTIEMSATPIPRSLTMSVYSSKDIQRITKKPAGRIPIQTASCSTDAPVFKFMKGQLEMGRQCYVVAPAIDDNEDAGLIGVNTVAKRYEEHFAPMGYRVALANGRMKDDEFTEAIDSFKNGDAHILVATTVIEVGVNVPNATVIAIEQAERFGLSQLHQLRGRVGRKDHKSYCVLITADRENPRITAMEKTADGFEIAEEDYRLRGPGDVHGTEQSGQNVFIEEILSYPDLFEKAKAAAEMCTEKNRYGLMLRHMYEEHDRLDRVYREGKKPGK